MRELSVDLVARLAVRANDPARRTYLGATATTAQPVDLTALMSAVMEHGAPQAQGLVAALQGLGGSTAGPLVTGPGGPASLGGRPEASTRLAPAPSDDALAQAEIDLGHALPDELRESYAIGDGGFGPGEGLFPLAELVRRYRDLTDEPFGPAGQDWPEHLLPVFEEDPVLVCLDLGTGAIVDWDPEEIEDEDDEDDWRRSFKPAAESLAALWEHWLPRPTFAEQHPTAS
ncbi:MAG: SMI1/KNR4 family protein [Nocardioidaceae bacterium]